MGLPKPVIENIKARLIDMSHEYAVSTKNYDTVVEAVHVIDRLAHELEVVEAYYGITTERAGVLDGKM